MQTMTAKTKNEKKMNSVVVGLSTLETVQYENLVVQVLGLFTFVALC